MDLKKYLPFVLLGVGLVVILAVFLFTKVRSDDSISTNGDEKVAEVPFDKRPVVSLTPIKDGRFLKLRIEKMDIGASTLDYELLYDVPGGVTQGVPGSVDIKGLSSFEAELLLGSESSGKFRYDEGVEQGTVTLRFRDDKGKLKAKFTSDFRMLTNVNLLESIDSVFSLKLDKQVKSTLLVMSTVGSKSKVPGEPIFGPYGIFSEDVVDFTGEATIVGSSKVYYDSGSYKEVSGSSSFKTPAIFVGR